MRACRVPLDILSSRRREVLKKLENSNQTLVLSSGALRVRNFDVHYSFRPQSDFFYLTGFDEPGAFLVLDPKSDVPEKMFVMEADPLKEMWEGFIYGPKRAGKAFGFQSCFLNSELEAHLSGKKDLVTNLKTSRFEAQVDTKFLTQFRAIKDSFELEQMQKAADISSYAHTQLMRATRPGVSERALHGLFIKSFMEKGAPCEAYGSIVAAGQGATTLHYTFNDQVLKKGEVILVDAGCEWNCYASDITRSYPVDAKFNADQARVYGRLLEIQIGLIDMLKEGVLWQQVQDQSESLIFDLLKDEGALSKDAKIEDKLHRKYYPHGFGHPLGLDVHDLGDRQQPLVNNCVFTVEPGVYFPQDDKGVPESLRGLGVRIEDDVVLTKQGPLVLSRAAPKTISEIESVVGSKPELLDKASV